MPYTRKHHANTPTFSGIDDGGGEGGGEDGGGDGEGGEGGGDGVGGDGGGEGGGGNVYGKIAADPVARTTGRALRRKERTL